VPKACGFAGFALGSRQLVDSLHIFLTTEVEA